MRQNKSFLEQLSDCNKVITGRPLDIQRIEKEKHYKHHKNNDEIRLDRRQPTNTNIPGYSARKMCYITIATTPDNYVHPKNRLDAPCEVCINRQCPYSQGIIRR